MPSTEISRRRVPVPKDSLPIKKMRRAIKRITETRIASRRPVARFLLFFIRNILAKEAVKVKAACFHPLRRGGSRIWKEKAGPQGQLFTDC